MTKLQLLKQLNLPESASDMELIIELSDKINTAGFLLFEDFDIIQIIPGKTVKGKVSQIVL